jgi:hypothetical protein
MTLVKSVLIASAAGLATVAGAQAADLAAKATPVEYVRVCSAYGSGFFYIPGTETCLRVGGRVRFELRYLEPFTRADNSLIHFVRGRIQADARTATSYGLLRTFLRYEIDQSGANPQTGVAITSPSVVEAFVQFNGLTAGKVISFFANPDLPTTHMGTLRFDDAPDVIVLAYTYSFGNGLSATLSLEDGLVRRNNPPEAFITPGTTVGAPFVVGAPFPLVYGGQSVPDIVGNIRTAGTWGSAQIAGALHQIRDVGVATSTVISPVTGLPVTVVGRVGPTGILLPEFGDTRYGWAAQFQGSLNFPSIAAGDAAWFAAGYSSGAASYAGFGNLFIGPTTSFGTITLGAADAIIDPFSGEIKKTNIWNVAGGFTHYWIPEVYSSVFGSYAHVDFGGANSVALTAGPFAGASVGFVDYSEWRIGGNTFWTPVSGLNLGLEVLYAQSDFRHRVVEAEGSALATRGRFTSDVGRIEGRFRVQRDF